MISWFDENKIKDVDKICWIFPEISHTSLFIAASRTYLHIQFSEIPHISQDMHLETCSFVLMPLCENFEVKGA